MADEDFPPSGHKERLQLVFVSPSSYAKRRSRILVSLIEEGPRVAREGDARGKRRKVGEHERKGANASHPKRGDNRHV